jgi:NADP-dependent 3-hydroxy acid dehydrogenase YdfG
MKTIFYHWHIIGLGKATAKLFQSKGWKVIATLRHPEKETELNQLDNVTVLPLDVTNLGKSKILFQSMEIGNIDVVFNNAGYGYQVLLKQLPTNKSFDK